MLVGALFGEAYINQHYPQNLVKDGNLLSNWKFERTRIKDISIFANYSTNNAKSDTDGAGTFPANQYDLSGEYGRSSLDTRHRFIVGSNFDVPWGIRGRPFIIFRSGTPFNITNGIDSNSDALFTERPTFAQLASRCDQFSLTDSFCDFSDVLDFTRTIPRNYGTGPEYFNVNLRLSKEFEFGTRSGGDSADSGGGRGGRFGGPFGNSGGNRGGSGDEEEGRYKLQFNWKLILPLRASFLKFFLHH